MTPTSGVLSTVAVLGAVRAQPVSDRTRLRCGLRVRTGHRCSGYRAGCAGRTANVGVVTEIPVLVDFGTYQLMLHFGVYIHLT